MEKSVFLDHADWERVKLGGDAAIKQWINSQLDGSSVTVVLIGTETSQREYVKYELKKSWEEGKGILGIYIHNCKDQYGRTDTPGNLNFELNFKNQYGEGSFSQRFKTYDWIINDGRNNIEKWIEAGATEAGR